METSSTIQLQLSEEKWGKFKEDIKNVEEISKKIENFFIKDYEAIFPEILLISKNQFLSNIKKGVYSTLEDLYSDNIKFDKKLQSLIDDNLKKIEEKYELNFKLLKKEWTNYHNNKNDINYLFNYRKHCFNDSEYASHNCNNNISKFIVISINNDNNENEFVICSNCQKIYKSSFILCKCFYCDIEYYSQKLPEDQNTDLFLATWKEYHCPQLINNKMSCIKCKSPFYLNMKTGMLNCVNKDCQFVSKPKRILWTCNNCKKDFTSDAIVYNPLDVEIIQKVIKQTLLLKHRAHPNKIPCCKLNIFFTEFYHKKSCKGTLYLGEINDELIIVCEKCHAINYYARFIWTCPKCQTKFRTKKKEITQSDYNSHKSDEFSNDKIISLKDNDLEKENKNDIQSNQIEDKNDENENEINTKENNNDNENKVIDNKNECQEIKEQESGNKEIEDKNKEDDVVNVIRKNSIKAVVASPIKNKYRNSYQSFRNRRHNRLNTEVNKPLSLLSMEKKDNNDLVQFDGNDNNENKYQRKSMNVFNRKYKRGITDFRIGKHKEKEKEKEEQKDKKKKIEEEENKDTNEVKKKDEDKDKEKEDENKDDDVKQNNESNNYYKSNYRNRYKKRFDKNRNKKEDNKDSNINENESNKIDENKGDNKANKASENDNDNNDESKNEAILMRTNTTNERNFIDRRRSVYMHYRQLRLQNLEKKENQTQDEDKNKQLKTENDEKEDQPEKISKFRTRGVFSKFLFLGNSNDNFGGSAKNNFLERNLLRRASLQVPYNSGLRARFNKKENSRKSSSSSSSSSSFSDKIDNIKYVPKDKINLNSLKDKDTNNFKDKNESSLKGKNEDSLKSKNENSLKSKNEDSLKDKNEDSLKNKNEDSLQDKNENSLNDKDKNKAMKNNITKNIKENSKKSTKVSSKESDKENSKKLLEKSQEKKEEVKEDEEEQEEEEDDFDDDEDEDQTKGIEVNNSKNDDTNNNNTSNTQYIQSIPGISDHLLAHITKRINHILSNTKISQFNLEDYSIYRKLGEGSYGIIHCIIHEKTKEKYALKKIIAHSLKKIAEFTKEFELVHICHHPNILKIYGLNINILDQSTYSLQVLMEKAERDWDKDIKRRLQERRYYTEDELISIMKQLTSALLFMKEKLNITHRDIKPQNVLIFNDGIFKLADFGEAKEIKVMKNLNTLRGTELYMSPALYNGLKVNQDDVAHDPFKSDLFSLGFCLVYAATFNFNLLYKLININNDESIRKKIREHLKDNYSEKFIWILTKMVELEEKNRFDFKQLADEIDKNYGK